MEDELQRLRDQMKMMQEGYMALQINFQRKQNEFDTDKANQNNLLMDFDRLRANEQNLQNELDRLMMELEKYRKRNQVLQDKLADLESELENLDNDYKRKLDDLNKEWQNKYGQIELYVGTMQNDLNKAKRDLLGQEALTDKLKNKADNAESLQFEISNLGKELDDANAQLQDLQDMNYQLNMQLQDVNKLKA